MCFLLSGYSGSKAIYGVLLTLCAARLAYLFLFANPEQVASLSNIPFPFFQIPSLQAFPEFSDGSSPS